MKGASRPDKPMRSAAALALRIERQVLDLPPGAFIGVEGELLEAYKVGRGTLREAIGCLERRGVAHMARGASGGLYVSAEASESLASSVSLALEMLGPSFEDLSAVGSIFKRHVAGLAALNADETQSRDLVALASAASRADTLVQYAERRRVFQRALTAASGDRILGGLIDASARAMMRGMPMFDMIYRDFDEDVDRLKEAECAVAEAIAAKDAHRAQTATDISAGVELASYRRALSAGRLQVLVEIAWQNNASAVTAKAAQWVVWALRREISHALPDCFLGSERDLAERFGVGRAVMREALRMLADFGLVAHRPGAGGGVFARRFDPWLATAPLAIWVTRTPGDVWSARTLVEAEAARLVAIQDVTMPMDCEITGRLVDACPNAVLGLLLALLATASRGASDPVSPFDDRLRQAIAERDAYFARRYAMERCDHLAGR